MNVNIRSTKLAKLIRSAGPLLPAAVACGLALAVCVGWLRAAAAAEMLPENILRLHVVANSDSAEDQALKLKVRDAVLEEAGRWCRDAETMEQANAQVCTHLESVAQAAEKAVRAEGAGQQVRVQMTEMFFPTKEYEGFSLPAGRYRALRVTLGSGAGHNWWCVVFPALCLPAAGGDRDLLAALPEDQRKIAQEPGRYRVELKVTELYERLKEWARGLPPAA